MSQRTTHQNRLYHELCHQLYRQKKIIVYDGRFEHRNPVMFMPCIFTYDEFRVWVAELNLDYRRDKDGKPVSTTELTTQEMSSHIMFLEVLLTEV